MTAELQQAKTITAKVRNDLVTSHICRRLHPESVHRPLGERGEMTVANFTPMNIVEYYRATGPVYAKAHGEMFAQGEETEQDGEGSDGQ